MRDRLRGARHDDQGFSMVEVIIAMFVFAVAVLGLASVAMSSVLSLRHTRDREQATNAASTVLEEVRSRDFGAIFLDAADPGITALGGCFEGEPIVDNAVSAPAGVTAVPHEQTMGNGNIVTVETFVTYYQDGDGTPDTCTPEELRDVDADPLIPQLDVKRVVAVATWEDRDGPRSVTQATLITAAGRGLPVPDFELSPPEAEVAIHIDQVTSPEEVCVRHQLRNLGAVDDYEWVLESVEGAASGPFRLNATQYETPNDKYYVRAFFQYPATSTSDTPPDPNTDPTTQLMTDGRDGGPTNLKPESDLDVAASGSANVWFCYTAMDTALAVGDTITAHVAINSRFNENRIEQATHTVTVVDQADVLYLYDRLDSTAHSRDDNPNTNQENYPVMRMGPQDGLADSEENLGTANYSNRAESDWDEDVDVDDLPGLRLIRGVSTLDTAEWHEQFLDTTTIERNATLVLWMATTESLNGTLDDDDHDTHQDQSFQVRVERLHTNERNVQDSLLSATVSYHHGDPGWQRVEIPLDFGGAHTFASNEFLSVEVTCLQASDEDGAGSDSDCHIAYDNIAHASGLLVNIR